MYVTAIGNPEHPAHKIKFDWVYTYTSGEELLVEGREIIVHELSRDRGKLLLKREFPQSCINIW